MKTLATDPANQLCAAHAEALELLMYLKYPLIALEMNGSNPQLRMQAAVRLIGVSTGTKQTGREMPPWSPVQ